MNQNFYNEYLEYQRVYNYLDDIANEIKNVDDDFSKPILFVAKDETEDKSISLIKESYLEWGIEIFDENGTEIIKFLNHIGYTEIQLVQNYDEAMEIYENVEDEYSEDIIELEDFIVVKIDY